MTLEATAPMTPIRETAGGDAAAAVIAAVAVEMVAMTSIPKYLTTMS
jgi:hypothetical protein